MTALEWIRTILASHIQEDTIILDETQAIPAPDFGVIFGTSIDAELAKPVADQNFYTALSGSQTFIWTDGETYTMTAAEMLYQVYLDQWHAEGLI